MSLTIEKAIVDKEKGAGKSLTANLRQAKSYTEGAEKMLNDLRTKVLNSNIDTKRSLNSVLDYLDEAENYLDKKQKNLSSNTNDSSKSWIEDAKMYLIDAQKSKGEELKNAIDKIQETLKKAKKSIDNKSIDLEKADNASKVLAESLANKVLNLLGEMNYTANGNPKRIELTKTIESKPQKRVLADDNSTTYAIKDKLDEHGIIDAQIVINEDGTMLLDIPFEYTTNDKGEKLLGNRTAITTMRIRAHNVSEDSEAYIVHIGGQSDNFKQDKNAKSNGTTASGRLAFGCEDNNVGIVEVMFVDEKGKYGTTGASIMADKDTREKEREIMISVGETLNEANSDIPCVETGHSTGSQVKMMETFVAKDSDGSLNSQELNQVRRLYDTYDMLMPQDTNHDAVNRVTGGQVEGKKSSFPENVPGEFVLDSNKITYAFGSDGLVSTAVTPKKDKSTQKASSGYFTIYTKLLTEDGDIVDIQKEEVKNEKGRVVETKLYTENKDGEKDYIELQSIEMKKTSHTYTAIDSSFGEGSGKINKDPLTYEGDEGLLYSYLRRNDQEMKDSLLIKNFRKRSKQ